MEAKNRDHALSMNEPKASWNSRGKRNHDKNEARPTAAASASSSHRRRRVIHLTRRYVFANPPGISVMGGSDLQRSPNSHHFPSGTHGHLLSGGRVREGHSVNCRSTAGLWAV